MKKQPAPKKKSIAAMVLPDIADKIAQRSYHRSGVVAGGTLLGSSGRQATATFTSPVSDKRKGD